MPHPLESLVHLAPAVFPGAAVPVQPGDLTRFAPSGMGLNGPFPIRPWDDPFGPSPARFCGFQQPAAHPLRDAPLSGPAGGTVYFDDGITREDFNVLLRVLGVGADAIYYAVFLAQSARPAEDRFLNQVRLVQPEALTASSTSCRRPTRGSSSTTPRCRSGNCSGGSSRSSASCGAAG
ncbi:MAG: hypothetical protein WDO13_12430 [Verrucomicrobiota bacterium]